MNFMFSWQEQYLTSERSERVRYCSCHENIKFISSGHRVISSIYYHINTSEISRELSRINMISSHVKITWTLFSEVKRSPLLWLQNPLNPLRRTYLCSCMIETSSVLPGKASVIFRNFRKMFGNDCLVFGQLMENLYGENTWLLVDMKFLFSCSSFDFWAKNEVENEIIWNKKIVTIALRKVSILSIVVWSRGLIHKWSDNWWWKFYDTLCFPASLRHKYTLFAVFRAFKRYSHELKKESQ